MNLLTKGWFPTVICSESVKMTTFEIADFAVFIAEYPQLFSKSSVKNVNTFTFVEKELISLRLQNFSHFRK